jgi:hypothetical protein
LTAKRFEPTGPWRSTANIKVLEMNKTGLGQRGLGGGNWVFVDTQEIADIQGEAACIPAMLSSSAAAPRVLPMPGSSGATGPKRAS